MAEQPLKQTAATDATPGHKPSGAGSNKPAASARENNIPLDLDAALADELGDDDGDNEIIDGLDDDLPAGVKKGATAPGKPEGKGASDKAAKEEDEESDPENGDDEADPDPDGDEDDKTNEDDEDDSENDEALSDALDEAVDSAKPPKGYENVPKGIWMRHNKMRADNRALREQIAEGPIVLKPTSTGPLNDVQDIAALDERVNQAREDRKWARANPEGGSRMVNGKSVEVSATDAARLLDEADAIIDADAQTRTFLLERKGLKPAEAATKLEPDLFIKGSPANNLMSYVLERAPEITRKIPDWEKLMAYASIGVRRTQEEASGKFKYVRFEVGPDGKLIAPKGKSQARGTETAGGDKPKPNAAENRRPAPTPPSQQRPPIKRQTKPSAVETRVTDSDADLSAQLAAELGE